ncbi:hypothetical protein HYH03_003327 [Edaphochlamys debaryana]|uniref:Uncharacterized protein n=1 Tax=Edaphochlamys debaryana TaxID=47281 RepID=A0A835YCZ9_9CHLO|nr:hypothetical protein HYH03_003327 [Edaphochlamys debaryana]|eukprot:KAG2498576.1 hypothetical protein HYH03_003327 [Edaphochlamys debaryana]
MGGYFGMNIIAPGYPKLVAVACVTFTDPAPTAVDATAAALTSVLKYEAGEGKYMLGFSLKDNKAVISTCYKLQLKFATCPARIFAANINAVRNK